jgi:hypothetical protein
VSEPTTSADESTAFKFPPHVEHQLKYGNREPGDDITTITGVIYSARTDDERLIEKEVLLARSVQKVNFRDRYGNTEPECFYKLQSGEIMKDPDCKVYDKYHSLLETQIKSTK